MLCRDAGAMLSRQRDRVGCEPDAMGDGGPWRQEADIGRVTDHRAAMVAIDRARLHRLRLGLVDTGEDRQPMAPRGIERQEELARGCRSAASVFTVSFRGQPDAEKTSRVTRSGHAANF